jgi:phosphatidylglycerol:prolipoprotein diacylglycerol transferase
MVGAAMAMAVVLGTWVHNMDPVLWKIAGPLQLRYYGLSYLLGFVAGYYLLKALAKRHLWVVEEDKVGDFIAFAAMFGVFLGGRLGYVFFYMIPERGIDAILNDPVVIFRVWDGGMSSHGGFLGLMGFTYVYSRMMKLSWPAIGDGLVVACPLGLLFGRLANFINGELYGRVADGVAWAVKFPGALFDGRVVESSRQREVLVAIKKVDPDADLGNVVARMRDNPELTETVGRFLEPRHPSQLYEAFLEGVVLFAILFFLRVKFPRLATGVLTGTFFAVYAVFRIVVEAFREPDSSWVVESVLTKGQFYSLFMFLIAAGFYVYAWKWGRKAVETDEAG